MRLIILLLLFVNFLSLDVLSQKFEREYSIKQADVPENALSFIKQLNPSKNVKWYRETSQNGESIEAKLILNGKLHSIEFDTLGNVEDVEIVIDEKEIESSVYSRILEELNKLFSKFKFRKVQQQYIGERLPLIHTINNKLADESIIVNYETIIKGINKDGTKLYEITFNKVGKLIKKEVIIFKNSDHLEY